MSNRIPSSLNWLVKKRAKTHGELLHLEKNLETYNKSIEKKILKLKEDLEALDKTISLHEITISPNKIPPKVIQTYAQNLKHGELTQIILECFKNDVEAAKNVKDIIYYVSLRLSLDLSNTVKYRSFYNSIRKRLQGLYAQGVLERLPKEKNHQIRFYKLKIE